jgi:hypothetical protein
VARTVKVSSLIGSVAVASPTRPNYQLPSSRRFQRRLRLSDGSGNQRFNLWARQYISRFETNKASLVAGRREVPSLDREASRRG